MLEYLKSFFLKKSNDQHCNRETERDQESHCDNFSQPTDSETDGEEHENPDKSLGSKDVILEVAKVSNVSRGILQSSHELR